MNLDFNEIGNDKKFEDLLVSYFEDLRHEKDQTIVDVHVKPSGTGVDGGRDILVTFKVTDTIMTFERRWVVQCKFHTSDISTDKIADINIPTLLHSYNAAGYLLVCRQKPTSKLTDFFERLEKNCIFEKQYTIWSGEQLKRLILIKSKKEILQQYFPNYFNYCLTNKLFSV
jgi:Restriction endonuclease